MKTTKHWILQLFAEAAVGSTGEAGADAGHTQASEPRAEEPRQAAAAEPTPEAPRMTWEQVKADPEYSAHMQEMMRKRLKDTRQAQQVLQTLTPALQKLAQEHGLDPQATDYEALARAITEPKQPDPLHAHYQDLIRQAQALRQRYPDFDLRRELENPTFARLTAPNVGISLEDAYYTVHRKGIEAAALQVTAQQTARRISNAIRAGSARPVENGTTDHGPTVSAFDYRNASRQQREALKSRIRQAGARGEKISPGDV